MFKYNHLKNTGVFFKWLYLNTIKYWFDDKEAKFAIA